jgi:hypothetical protein
MVCARFHLNGSRKTYPISRATEVLKLTSDRAALSSPSLLASSFKSKLWLEAEKHDYMVEAVVQTSRTGPKGPRKFVTVGLELNAETLVLWNIAEVNPCQQSFLSGLTDC